MNLDHCASGFFFSPVRQLSALLQNQVIIEVSLSKLKFALEGGDIHTLEVIDTKNIPKTGTCLGAVSPTKMHFASRLC